MSEQADRAEIADIVETFFAAFASGPGLAERTAALGALFLPQAVIVRTCGGEPQVYDVEAFLTPRFALLSGTELVDFREWALPGGRTDLFGDVAQHWSAYAKQGVQNGAPIAGRGMKTLQLVRTRQGWRISAAAWDDERDRLRIAG